MPTDPPMNARQRALQRRRARQEDEDLPPPPKTPPGGTGRKSARTATRAARAAKVVEMFPDKKPDPEERASKAPTREATIGKTRRRAASLGDRWSEVVSRVRAGEYTWEEFCATLTPEELARGQLMDDKGGFRGRPPEFVPRAFLLECQREIYRRFNEKMQERLLGATEEYIELSRLVDDPNTREKMLRYLIERVMGPVPKEVVVTTEKPFEGLIAKIASRARPAAEGEDSRYAKRDGRGHSGQ